jgi:hypothetical protein
MNYLAMGPHCWGKGKTREEAVKNAKVNFPYRYVPSVKRAADKHFSIYTSEGEFTVDGMGDIQSTKADITKIQTSVLATN